MARDDFFGLVRPMIRDDAGTISDPDMAAALSLAVVQYSKDRPRPQVADVAGDGTRFLAVPSAWDSDCSTLSELEYPVDEDPVSVIAGHLARIEDVPDGQRLRLRLPFLVVAGHKVRVRFTVPHVLDDDTDTVPVADRGAVAFLTAAFLLEQKAVHHSGDVDSSIAAGAVSRLTTAQQYAARAKEMRANYVAAITAAPVEDDGPACAEVSFTRPDSRGWPRLTHGGSGR